MFPDGKMFSISEYKTMADRFLEDWRINYHGGESGGEPLSHETLGRDYWDIVSRKHENLI